MKFALAVSAIAALTSGVAAQGRPTNTSICDYYTTALLKNNTAENQYTLLKLLVNTVVIGNYTMPNMNAVPGILAPGMINGTAVNLAPFFTGASGKTTNRGGVATSGVNFLDGGGATPLKNNTLPTAGSNQLLLVQHLYQYFGGLLGCSMQGQTGFSAYEGRTSQFAVHQYMYLTYAQNTYFIQQVALAAQSFGVASADITVVGTALNSLFNVRCAPSTSIPATAMAAPQSICVSSDCPLAVNSSCAAYNAAYATANATSGNGPNSTVVGAGNSGNGSTTARTSSAASGAAAASGSAGARSDGNTVAIGSMVAGAALVAALL